MPEPQNEWNDAYASFMGASTRYSSVISRMLGLWNYATLPVIRDGPLAPRNSAYPVCIFSHGLGGNFNTYSSIVGNLASCGIFCVATEHRDGSSPISFIKNAQHEVVRRVPYQKHSHSPTVDVLNARNAQLRIRLWELEMTFTAIKAMNEGKQLTNYAEAGPTSISLTQKLNLKPGKITFAGHSFGAATTTQFVKSVFYHKYLPETISSTGGHDTRPLLRVSPDSDLVRQITSDTPIALLDLWTMPLRGETSKWLWDRPMPSYHRSPDTKTPNMVAIISAEFYKWRELLNRTRAVLSRDPIAAITAFEHGTGSESGPSLKDDSTRPNNPIPELNKQEQNEQSKADDSTESSRTTSPTRSMSDHSAASSQSSLVPNTEDIKDTTEPHLYYVPQSAHLSQSDFGVLFPNLTKYVMKAVEPEKTIELNLRAILAVVRSAGHEVESLVEDERILSGDGLGKDERWVRVPLIES